MSHSAGSSDSRAKRLLRFAWRRIAVKREEAGRVGLAIVRRHLAGLRTDRRQDRFDDHRCDIVECHCGRETRRSVLQLGAAKDRSLGIVQEQRSLQRLCRPIPRARARIRPRRRKDDAAYRSRNRERPSRPPRRTAAHTMTRRPWRHDRYKGHACRRGDRRTRARDDPTPGVPAPCARRRGAPAKRARSRVRRRKRRNPQSASNALMPFSLNASAMSRVVAAPERAAVNRRNARRASIPNAIPAPPRTSPDASNKIEPRPSIQWTEPSGQVQR